MKVAILSDFPLHLLPGFEGSKTRLKHWSTWLPQLAGQFAKMKSWDMHWIVLTEEIESPCQFTHQEQTFHILPTAQSGRASSFYREDLKAISAILKQIQPHIVHGWGSEDVYGLAAVRSGFPSILSMQGILSYYALKNLFPWRTYFQVLVEIYLLRKATVVTVESEWGRQILRKYRPHAPLEIVEYGVQDHFFEMKWAPDPAKPIVVFIGTVTPRKGIQDAIEAFRSPDLAHAELWVIGDLYTPWAEELKQNSPSNTRWLGQIDPSAIAEHLCHSWCLVLPTRADTSPNVIKEARVIGLPVISTRHGGQATYVIEGETGFLIQPGDTNSLTNRLVQLTTSLPLCRELGATMHQVQRHALSPSRTAERFVLLYEKYGNAHSVS